VSAATLASGPVPKRRGRRRLIGWLVALAVLLGLLVAADRVSAALAGSTAQKYLAQQAYFQQASFQQSPKVQVRGFPFLTQALGGTYDDIEVTSSAVQLDGVTGHDLKADLKGVHLSASAVFDRHVTSLPVDSVAGSVRFDYPDLATLIAVPGVSGLTLSASGDQLLVSATVTVPVLNVRTLVSGSATIRVAGGTVALTVTGLSASGLTVPAALLQEVAASLSVPISIPALPYGLQIDRLTPEPTGILVTGSATHIVVTRS
jgi:hypothetical protein